MSTVDMQANKLELIEWLAGLQDAQLIHKVKSIMESSEPTLLSREEKRAIDQGLDSIEKNRIHTNDEVRISTREKFPQLFK